MSASIGYRSQACLSLFYEATSAVTTARYRRYVTILNDSRGYITFYPLTSHCCSGCSLYSSRKS